MKNNPMEQYWNNIITAWEDSSYKDGERAPWLEKLAGKFRAHIVDRHNSCVAGIKNYVNGKTVVEIGCASGPLSFEMVKMGATKVIGLDIAEQAVSAARARAKSGGVPESKATFHRYTIGETLPFQEKADLVVGLGITEYVTPDDLVKFLKAVSPQCIFISFDESNFNLQKFIHYFYRTYKQIPYYKRYSQEEMKSLMESAGFKNVRTFREGKNAFVTNIN